jgi:SPX domain protein involved in polyphosphate accumulation
MIWMINPEMKVPVFSDRIEKKYQMEIDEANVASLWRELVSFLAPYGLVPVQEIVSVGSVYFDNKDYDLLHYSLLGRLMLFRVRAYEFFGRPFEPIKEYWIEVKTAQGERRRKRRFRLTKDALVDFFDGKEPQSSVFDCNKADLSEDDLRKLYVETQESIFTMGLEPFILVNYKRIAFQSEAERLSIDWDVEYFPVSTEVYDHCSWKDIPEQSVGKANKVILELKYLHGSIPEWFADLRRKYPIREKEFLKTLEGMGFVFQGPLRDHRKASSFIPLIDAYMGGSQALR